MLADKINKHEINPRETIKTQQIYFEELELFLVPITRRHINAETLHQVVEISDQYY